MTGPDAILTLVTLGVADLERSTAFYEALGFKRKASNAEGVGFFQAGAIAFAVWPADELAKDANKNANAARAEASTFRGVALAWNCRSEGDVDAAIERARAAGATVLKPARKTFWGGYAGYFADPDGHLWEVAHNPGFPLSDDGRLLLPE
jgi:catechol 2,3-dioxygenase-like lactoylglutathione lyase family enzyme